MANTKSAEKRVRQEKKRTLHNKSYKASIRTTIKKFLDSLTSGDTEKIKTQFPKAISLLDKAEQKGIHHRNYVARKKSALYAKYNAFLSLQKK